MVPRIAEDLDERAQRRSTGIQPASTPRGDQSIELGLQPVKDVGAHRLARRRQASNIRIAGRNSTSRAWVQPLIAGMAGALTFAVSFSVAMVVTKPAKAPSVAMQALASSTVSDLKTLMAAVKAAGLRGTPDVKGAIDEVTRIDSDRVILKGWAVEIGAGNQPLTVMAFVDGRSRLTVQTSGGRPASANALGSSDTAATNMSFEGQLKCSMGQKLMVVAVGPSDVYGHFGSRICP